jgi:aminopeptidase N
MEHVGAIQYRANSLFLDENPSDTQLLGRANLIAHESAHMWFGNLVTMDWFNDVWTKEVYANFMAAKIVNPSFPNVDHDLNFLSRSYPAAYSVDRTEGANPIRQNLPNLNEAGTLYGAINYNKAPIMMQQLELLLGADAFQGGIREYMQTFAGGNATWPDLINIFDKRTDTDVKAWSEVWVNTPGRPEFDFDGSGLLMRDPAGHSRVWPQVFGASARNNLTNKETVSLEGASAPVSAGQGEDVFLNADGLGYGLFPANVTLLREHYSELNDLQKGSLLIMLYEQLLEAHEDVRPANHLRDLMRVIEIEDNQIILNLALGHMQRIFWSFLDADERLGAAQQLEALLWTKMAEAQNASFTKTFYRAYQNIALTDAAINRLYALWSEKLYIEKLRLSETDLIALAGTLAIKAPDRAENIISEQERNIKNPDQKRRFAFTKPALSSDATVRDAFFNSLKDSQNREVESWVLGAIGYLHHPLRVGASEKYILPSLELLEEIQRTGDIFFPARWTAVTMSNHRSAAAVKTVREFLGNRPDYNYQLKLKILQSADMMFRAQKVLEANGG